MRPEEWFEIYHQILSDFGFDEARDAEAARLMHRLAGDKLLSEEELRRRIDGKEVAVIGGAVESEIDAEVIVTAGKAILRWVELSSRIPDVHVTDMEEPEELLEDLERKGTLLVLHAHGDNMGRIRAVVPRIGKFVATTQHRPFDKVYNFGGFTDGDRAAIIAKRFGARSIILHGFRFEGRGVKGKKLVWAKRILEREGLL
ncbi:putative Rossmann fold enzyme [Geoglobus ahangari]|uniref:6-hydroxymethyl-7,8-dihydropterin pyrophosphokinase n=1 Tax=Geoglobus ahangari TaxID=113653 RepID=A0A0F7ID84_9EURY|nr:6-hydroxymethylpterin diphosphokinase MptE-like protein [Geoglobus ahangari]AKG91283.1 putative Rossmann fold enzyme [Geoglobus ahangari]